MAYDSILMVDLDGTLIKGSQVHVSDIVARVLLPLAIDKRLIINTARHPQGVAYALRGVLPFVPTIALNGAAICKYNWEIINEYKSFEARAVDVVLNKTTDFDITLCLYTENSWEVTRFDNMVEHEAYITGMVPELISSIYTSPVLKMIALGANSDLDEFAHVLKGITDVTCARSNECYCEISPAGTNKTVLIESLLNCMGRVRDKIKLFFLGDSYNDIECALYSDSVYTYSSAPIELRRIAKSVNKWDTEGDLVAALQALLCEMNE